jgi:FemAB-related protein (PEP-CTERM system-associated)
MFSVRQATDLDQQRWDHYVLQHEAGGPYQLFAWQRAVNCAYGYSSYSILAENDSGLICGVLPLILIKPPLLKGMLVSQPYCDYGGIIADDSNTIKRLTEYAAKLSVETRAFLEIRCKEPCPELEKYAAVSPSNKVRMVLELPSHSEDLWNAFKSKLRSQIRRPMKDGIKFQLGSEELIDEFYKVFCDNMHDLGSPVHSKKWLKSILRNYSDAAKLGIVKKGDLILGGGIMIGCRNTITLPWASTLREYNHLSPNMLLYWGFLEYACNNGYDYFDFGRSTPDEGTFYFKKQWGAEPQPLFFYHSKDNTHMKRIQSAGGLRHHIEKTWSRLPLSFANFIGPLIRRYITL